MEHSRTLSGQSAFRVSIVRCCLSRDILLHVPALNYLEVLLHCLLVDIRFTHVDPIFDILPALVERGLEL